MKGNSKTPRDDEYIEAYYKTRSTVKAAKLCGVSRETVARACRRENIKLDGRKLNGGNGNPNPQRKITDEQLIEASRTMNCVEIALMYNMSPERVYRRAKNLGIKIDSKNVGGHYRKRMLNYNLTTEYEEGITLKRVRAKYNDVCQICGLLVDDTAIENGHIKRLYPTVDHIIPLSKGGSHTWENVRLAHMSCNAGKCDRND